ncbi:MAG: beta-lactamase family protein [Bacteroidales bacterium]|nr:beta-lactamase family protein [Bacteroidales bacterium]
MKKLLSLALAVFLTGGLFSCGAATPEGPAETPAGPRVLTEAQLAKLEKDLTAIARDHDVVSMQVAFVVGDEIVYSHAVGLKNFDSRVPASTTDLYRIASVSKSFSGVSTMQLVDAGKLSLDADVSDIVGFRVRNPKFPKVPITVRMLLSHTSSIVDSKVSYKKSFDVTLNPATASATNVAACYSNYEPGTHYQYSNRGINLLGAVIEKVSGERFDNYVRGHILLPLGITDAGFNVDSLDRTRFASLYTINDVGDYVEQTGAYERYPQYDTYRLGIDTPHFSPAGGMKISILGLAEWMLTLKRGGLGRNGVRILPADRVEQMFQKATPDNSTVKYGFTLSVSKTLLGFPMRGHTGSAYGLKSVLSFSLDQDFGVVVFCSSVDGETGRHGGVAAYSEAAELLYNAFVR